MRINHTKKGNNMKKGLVFILAAALSLSFSMTVFAEEKTAEKPAAEKTEKVEKKDAKKAKKDAKKEKKAKKDEARPAAKGKKEVSGC